jgi:hypothetical protein
MVLESAAASAPRGFLAFDMLGSFSKQPGGEQIKEKLAYCRSGQAVVETPRLLQPTLSRPTTTIWGGVAGASSTGASSTGCAHNCFVC